MHKKIKKVKKGGFLQSLAVPIFEKTSNQVDDLIGTIFGNAIKKRKINKRQKKRTFKKNKNFGGTIVQSGPLP
jgi:hypothetical protein